MSEILNIKMIDGTFYKVKIFYDSMSQHSMCSKSLHKIMSIEWTSPYCIAISTLNGNTCRRRNMCRIPLLPGSEIECIMLDDLQIDSVRMHKPSEWEQYNNDWSEEITSAHDHIDAAILVGADQARYMPLNELDKSNNPIETDTAVLYRSRLSMKLIAFGHNRVRHSVTSNLTCELRTSDTLTDDIINIESDDSGQDTDFEDDNNLELCTQTHTLSVPQPIGKTSRNYKYQFRHDEFVSRSESEAEGVEEINSTQTIVHTSEQPV
jgi:hypothetical protein